MVIKGNMFLVCFSRSPLSVATYRFRLAGASVHGSTIETWAQIFRRIAHHLKTKSGPLGPPGIIIKEERSSKVVLESE